jgi:hypothetical protein
MIKRRIISGLVLAGMIATSAFAQQPPQKGPLMFNAPGSWLGQMSLFQSAITPAATSAAIQTAEQTFTVTGLLVGDIVFVESPATPTSLCPLVGARVSALNTLALDFTVLTAAACTPVAGTYTIIDLR